MKAFVSFDPKPGFTICKDPQCLWIRAKQTHYHEAPVIIENVGATPVAMTKISSGVVLGEGCPHAELLNKSEIEVSIYRTVRTGPKTTETYEAGRLQPGETGKY